jgi:heme/copper-type cytochrome/quinol oxidase subunit 3
MLASSIAVHRGWRSVRCGRAAQARRNLLLALALSVAFIAVQTPALVLLLHRHAALRGSRFPS